MKNNYDAIAKSYDFLSRLVFGQNLVRAQIYLLGHIPAGSHILIAGGGTGWILEEIARIHPAGLSITYIEISEKMIDLAKKCNAGQNQVSFVHTAIEDYTPEKKYDIVLTAFLFDNFGSEKGKEVFKSLSLRLKDKGKWLFADFYIGSNGNQWWQKILLQTMLTFFRLVSQVEARQLTSMHPVFREAGFNETETYYLFHRFIRSSVYVRI